MQQSVTSVMFLVFSGTAVLSTLALFSRQSLLVAYILLGALVGPWGFGWVKDSVIIQEAGDIGIIFLLFLLGLDLQPRNLLHSLKKMSSITCISSLSFLLIGALISRMFHLSWQESAIIGMAMMFSSTIIGLKLLPTTILHHQHTGQLMISILLLQDLIAIVSMLVLQAISVRHFALVDLGIVLLAFPLLLLIAYLFERYVLTKLISAFDTIHEYIFILSIGWCLCMAELAHFMGLSEQVGAFVAGITLATNPISLYIAESLKPVRDFFLVIFFFTIGAGFNFDYLMITIWPALALATAMLLLKPLIFSQLLIQSGEKEPLSVEIGVRLGQISEFSLLLIFIALQTKLVRPEISYIVQAATVFTFIVSCYWVAMRYPTPLATTSKLRRD